METTSVKSGPWYFPNLSLDVKHRWTTILSKQCPKTTATSAGTAETCDKLVPLISAYTPQNTPVTTWVRPSSFFCNLRRRVCDGAYLLQIPPRISTMHCSQRTFKTANTVRIIYLRCAHSSTLGDAAIWMSWCKDREPETWGAMDHSIYRSFWLPFC